MPRVLLILLTVLLLVAPGTASAKTYSVDVPKTLSRQIAKVKAASDVPVLLPSRVRAERRRLYGRGTHTADGYELGVDLIRGCGGANACAHAFFSAQRGGEPFGRIRVQLAGSITGFYKPLSCGASCSPPSIEWVTDGILYEIQADVGSRKWEKRRIVALANSAIRNGPR
jgi:hypothetical protein